MRRGPAAEGLEVREGRVVVVVRVPGVSQWRIYSESESIIKQNCADTPIYDVTNPMQIQSYARCHKIDETKYGRTTGASDATKTRHTKALRTQQGMSPTGSHRIQLEHSPERLVGAVREAGAAEDGGPLAGGGVHAAGHAVGGAGVHQVLQRGLGQRVVVRASAAETGQSWTHSVKGIVWGIGSDCS